MLSYSWGMTSNKPGCEARHLRLYRLSRHPLYSSIATSVGRTAGSGDPRRTRQIRNESSRDQRAVKTNFAACPRPLWVKVVRLADGEDVAEMSSGDTIPNCLGELGEIRERTDGGSAGPGPVSGFRDEPALGPVSGFRDVRCGNI